MRDYDRKPETELNLIDKKSFPGSINLCFTQNHLHSTEIDPNIDSNSLIFSLIFLLGFTVKIF